ncbi:transposase [Cytobacillus solani]|uniref:exonuclease domain-containing protein n=1 Tax=Cytobacillus solani TaxID=1637975 RepID=UPI00207966AE|nr:exonuclease domain-containing protein [Cytobacillus solani]USK54545.1 transposase [Cytobacillus solani]
MDFITIDFEIANNHMNSACSLGMVFIQNNKIIDEKYYLIQPPTLELDQEMSKIHGLSFDDLKNAPKFDEVWGEISHYFHNESLFVAHNAQFDMNVLRNCLKTYSIERAKTSEYKAFQKLRRVWCEGSFGTLKFKHNLYKTYKRGIEKISEQCLFSALALNLKRIIKVMN